MLAHTGGDDQVLVGLAAEGPLGLREFVGAEGGAVGLGGVLLGGSAEADMGAGDKEGRTWIVFGGLDGRVDLCQILPFHPQDLPAVGEKTRGDLFAESQVGFPLDGDAVVEVEGNEVTQAQMPRQGRRLGRHPFHEVAVGAEGVDAGVKETGVDPFGEVAGAHGHADADGEALPQGPGGRLDPGSVTELGVAGGATV